MQRSLKTVPASPSDSISPLTDLEIDELLAKTSRTFAACIPLLPGKLRKQVGVAYLLFRIADTIEDGTEIQGAEKRRLLQRFGEVVLAAADGDFDPRALATALRDHSITSKPGDALLLQHAARVIAAARAFDQPERSAILRHVHQSAMGMRRFISARGESGAIRLHSIEELSDYCYCVAGIVGEMLTELFLRHDSQLVPASDSLRSSAAGFGEALQLVNILKDSTTDQQEGRHFIPASVSRASLLRRARQKIEVARGYIETLCQHGADQGILGFTKFPIALAVMTLDQVEREGPGSKVPREQVLQILHGLDVSRGSGASLVNVETEKRQ